ncbi:MAG: cob(I)yrinic acid a,c-diamide adenosyltransferase [Stagnimonas sp.]|nr:cob(I)yrinic acid a,c-diamide adenosyltransferase [Stagnimonas sp.]
MGHRLSKIVTRTGDAGETGLATGDRISKTHARVDAMGHVDELNCCLGLLLVVELPEPVRAALSPCQHELFNLGGELSMPPAALITEAHVVRLDQALVDLNESLPPLKEFVLPGGGEAAARAHLARAVARRVERALWVLNAQEPVNIHGLHYTNRLSDLLFVCCRVLARGEAGEVSWKRG